MSANLVDKTKTVPNTIAKTNSTVVQTGTTTKSVPATSSASTTHTTATTNKSTSTSSSSAGTQSSSSSGASTPTQTPLSVLTSIIEELDNGSGFANVTTSSVTVPGPITDAQARPIVFSANGQTYFAYTQEQQPNFNQSASQTANSMAIVQATSSYTLTQAHLDKSGNLVDKNEVAVGYSTGGD